jgi:hypothetical protein
MLKDLKQFFLLCILLLKSNFSEHKPDFNDKNILLVEKKKTCLFVLAIFSDFNLVNKSLPWDYDFRFVIEEISNINDKAQVTSGFSSSRSVTSMAKLR